MFWILNAEKIYTNHKNIFRESYYVCFMVTATIFPNYNKCEYKIKACDILCGACSKKKDLAVTIFNFRLFFECMQEVIRFARI